MKRFIYADNAATSKLSPQALEAMISYLYKEYANPSQLYTFAKRPKNALKESRQIIAECIGASPEEIFFTSCGTESDNWAIHEAIERGYDIVTSSIEHHAVLHPCQKAEQGGVSVAYLSVDHDGLVSATNLAQNISRSETLVSIMMANNEIGSIQPIKDLCEVAHSKGALFHTDAVQAVGHIRIDVHDLGVDMLSASAHKFNGPKGIGFLYVRKGIDMSPYISGGGQEYGLRSGTENVASIVGMAVALRENIESLEKNQSNIQHLESLLLRLLDESDIIYQRNGADNHVPGNISLSFPGHSGESILHRLDLQGICISTGSACNSKDTVVSHVLKAIGLPDDIAQSTVRISLGKYNSEDEIISIVESLSKL